MGESSPPSVPPPLWCWPRTGFWKGERQHVTLQALLQVLCIDVGCVGFVLLFDVLRSTLRGGDAQTELSVL